MAVKPKENPTNCSCLEKYYCDCDMREKNITILRMHLMLNSYRIIEHINVWIQDENACKAIRSSMEEIQKAVDSFIEESF